MYVERAGGGTGDGKFIETKVDIIHVQKICDECEIGLMLPDGNMVLTSMPPLYPHKCNKCGHGDKYTEQYPVMRYREKE